jgi:hypothetical protein
MDDEGATEPSDGESSPYGTLRLLLLWFYALVFFLPGQSSHRMSSLRSMGLRRVLRVDSSVSSILGERATAEWLRKEFRLGTKSA